MKNHGFHCTHADHSMFVKNNASGNVILIIYADDILISRSDKFGIEETKEYLSENFATKDLGKLRYFLGIEIARSKYEISLCQRKYAMDLLKEIGLLGATPVDTPMTRNVDLWSEGDEEYLDAASYRRLAGKLIYLTVTRLDISFAFGLVSRFMSKPKRDHWEAMIHILQYIKKAPGKGLFQKNNNVDVTAYSDANYAGSKSDRKSTSGYCTYVGGNLVTWKSKRQTVVARSSAESEYRAMAQTTCEMMWVKNLLTEFGFSSSKPMVMKCDNQATIYIASNPVSHERTKHIEVDWHFIRNAIMSKEICTHVSSADQVRHYYYRLVRRMNKLLGPGFDLDAKNSKDTISAMLRWWSLLEKYSCTASKLHLKPRRFKIFIEALAHQLLKDRNKTRRKQAANEETYSFIPSIPASNMSKESGNEVGPVKLLLLDNQKNQKLGFTKRSSLKGSVNADINCSRGGFSIGKSIKQNRKTGLIASAAYRRWEKAAVAGVSLVADAAEQLEKTSDRINSSKHASFNIPSLEHCEDNAGCTVHPMPSSPLCDIHSSHLSGGCVQVFSKLKLQLFPVDDVARKILEKDDYNPYLELTLSARKRISSILEHLNRKWEKSKTAFGELTLLPYDVQVDDLMNCQKWTLRDKDARADDVYRAVGRPDVFRLRYGWLSNSEPGSQNLRSPSPRFHFASDLHSKECAQDVASVERETSTKLWDGHQAENFLVSPTVVPETELANISLKSKNLHGESLQQISNLSQNEPRNEKKQRSDEGNLVSNKVSTLSAFEWADTLTNISIGDLLSEASKGADSICNYRPVDASITPGQSIPFSCDSFDAAIAAHLSGYKDLESTSNRISQPSVWDAEDTCDEFSFKKIQEDRNVLYTSDGPGSPIINTESTGFRDLFKNVTETELEDGICEKGPKVKSQYDECFSQETHDIQNHLGLADIYWPDSLAAFDLDIQSFPRYLDQDMILGDSLNGLSRLIANSLDAFQNLSFSGLERRTPSAAESEEVASPSSIVKSEK